MEKVEDKYLRIRWEVEERAFHGEPINVKTANVPLFLSVRLGVRDGWCKMEWSALSGERSNSRYEIVKGDIYEGMAKAESLIYSELNALCNLLSGIEKGFMPRTGMELKEAFPEINPTGY